MKGRTLLELVLLEEAFDPLHRCCLVVYSSHELVFQERVGKGLNGELSPCFLNEPLNLALEERGGDFSPVSVDPIGEDSRLMAVDYNIHGSERGEGEMNGRRV